jgi:hypothetical protein
LSLSGDASGSVSWDGSSNATLSVTVADNSHSHNNYTPIDHFRHTGHGYYTSTTTSALLTEALGDDAFDSKLTAHKTGWSYAGNGNLTDAGRLTELAGTSWLWWTDNSTDNVQGNVTALAIAPSVGGSAGKAFIYNNQGSTYAPGWREIWTSTSDGAGSGLDADLLDGQHGSYYYSPANAPDPTLTLTGDVSGSATFTNLGNASLSVTVANDSHNHSSSSGNFSIGGALTINGSTTRGTYTTLSQYHSGADNIVLKGNSSGISSIFFESEKDGTNINHTSDFGFIQFHPYGTGTSGEANELIIGVSNDADDHVIFNAPNANGLKFRIGASATDYDIWHAGNDGSGSGLDADTLDGAHMSTTRDSANTIPRRDNSGFLQLGWINTTSGNTTGTLSDIYVNTNDGFIRKATPAHFRSQVTDAYYSKISDIAYGAWIETITTSNDQEDYVARVADDNDWMFIRVDAGTYTTGAGTADNPTVTRYRYRKVYRTFS